MVEFFRECRDGNIDQVRFYLANPLFHYGHCHDGFIQACLFNQVELVRLFLADDRVNPARDTNNGLRLAGLNGHLETVRLLLADPRVNPKGEDGIYIKCRDYEEYREVAIIDGVVCYVQNGNVASIKDEGIREKFVQWQYRIGGQKWKEARNLLG